MLRYSMILWFVTAACGGGDDNGDPISVMPDAGATQMMPDAKSTTPGEVMLVNPSVTHDPSTDVYTLSFWIKNNTASKMRAVTKVRVSAGYSYPEINSSDCPEDTPYYQWGLDPGELSPQLGLAFASSTTIPKTVIDMTCGSKEILKSVPYGFDDYPPFDLHIEGLLANGSAYVLDAVVQ
jgi:hypothetical protein